MFAPPGIRFREPERVKARALARLRHRHGLRDRLHAQLQNANAKGNGHPVFSFGLVYRNLGIRPRMLEAFDQSPHRFIQRRRDANLLAPFIKSTSVTRLASTSCNMLALCLPGAFAPFCTIARGSPCSVMPIAFATASPSAIKSMKSCPVGERRVAAP